MALTNTGTDVAIAKALSELNCKVIALNTPTTVEAVDCAGVETEINVKSTVQTVPHPTFVQKVSFCTNPDGTNPNPEVDALITSWLPICYDGFQYYVAEAYTVNNSTGARTFVGKLWKQQASSTVRATAPAGVGQDGYCKSSCVSCRQ